MEFSLDITDIPEHIREWWNSYPVETGIAIPKRTFINHLYNDMLENWSYNHIDGKRIHTNIPYELYNDDNSHKSPPPWNPTVRDIIYNSELKDIYDVSLILETLTLLMNGPIGMDTKLEVYHIKVVQSVADREFELMSDSLGVSFDEIVFDQDEIDEIFSEPHEMDGMARILLSIRELLEPISGDTQQTIQKNRQGLCTRGLEIIERVMETQGLQEGDYITICNIFKDLYK